MFALRSLLALSAIIAVSGVVSPTFLKAEQADSNLEAIDVPGDAEAPSDEAADVPDAAEASVDQATEVADTAGVSADQAAEAPDAAEASADQAVEAPDAEEASPSEVMPGAASRMTALAAHGRNRQQAEIEATFVAESVSKVSLSTEMHQLWHDFVFDPAEAMAARVLGRKRDCAAFMAGPILLGGMALALFMWWGDVERITKK